MISRINKTSDSHNLPKIEFEDINSGRGTLNKDISKKFDDRKGILFEPNDILYGKLRPYLKNWFFPNFRGIALGDFWVFRANMTNNLFMYYLIQSPIYQKVANDTSGTKMPRSDWKRVSNTSIYIPKSNEQKRIGRTLNKLDSIITLQQRQLDLYKKLKKGLLQKLFPSEGKKVPVLRFADFHDGWKQRQIKEYTDYRRGSFPQPYGDRKWYDETNGMPFVQVVDVGKNLQLVPDTKQKISKLAQSKSVLVQTGKVIVTLQGSIGRVAITQYPAYIDRTILIFEKYNIKMDQYFWAYVIQRKFDQERQKAPGGTIKTITKDALSKFMVSTSEYDEQVKIGLLFKQLDGHIIVQQRKLKDLQNLKGFYLQNLFI